MHNYAKVIDGAVVDRRTFDEKPPAAVIKKIDGAPVWRPVVVENQDYDPATQVRTGPFEVIEAKRVIDRYTIKARPRAEIETDKAQTIKADAMRRILNILPEWKQRNLTARAAELSMIVAGSTSLTTDQQAEWDTGARLWAAVTAIRTQSGVLEAGLATLSDADLASFDATSNEHWA